MFARNTHKTSLRTLACLSVAALAVFLLLVPARAGAAVLPKTSAPLPGSNFQAGDGDQRTPTAGDPDYDAVTPLVDWQTAVGTTTHYPDPNLNDNIFAGGNSGKVDTPDLWAFTVKDGGSTPGKNNILSAYSRLDPATSDTLLYLAFTRGDPTGTTFMGFELNKRSDLWTNSVGTTIPCRTTGDLLVTAQANGNDIDLLLQTWTTAAGETDPVSGCAKKGELSDFIAFVPNVDAQGHMNEAAITNYLPSSFAWPGNQIPEKLFGEAALNLTTIFEGATGSPCFSFGSIWMHTRASTADDSNMDDFIAPNPLLVRNCSASGTKFEDLDGDGTKDAGEPGLEGFRIWADYDNDGVRDAGEPFDDTDADGVYEITNVQDPSGTYSLREQLTSGAGSTGGWTCTAPATTGPGGDFSCAHTGIDGSTTPNASGKDFGNFRQPTIEVVKELEPSTDGGTFDLLVDGTSELDDAGDGDTTGAVDVGAGTHTVGESGDLADYDTSLTCTGKAGLPTDASLTGDATRTSADISVVSGDAIVCTLTNTRRGGSVKVVKDVRPDDTDQDDTGRFDIDIEGGSLDLDEAADGDEATVDMQPTQDVSITETEDGDDTDLSKYDTSISCVNGAGQPVVTQGTTAEIDVESDDAWVCTVINVRRTGSVKVVKDVRPDDTDQDDAGRFDIDIEGGSLDLDEAADGDDATVDMQPAQDVSITETEDGDDTDLADYDTSISCQNGTQQPVVTQGTTADIDVDSGDAWVCTVINVRKQGSVTVVKDVRPDATDQDDAGRFDIDIEGGSLDLDEAADGDDATVDMQPTQDVSITETEDGDDTDLSKYDTSISCVNGNGQPVVTQGTTAEIDVESNDAWVCTVINVRRTGSVKVIKDVRPDDSDQDDTGRFDIDIEGGSLDLNEAKDGDNATVDMQPTENVSITETEDGDDTDLSKYVTQISCVNGQGDPVVTAGATAEIDVDSNDSWVCTVINTRKAGSVTVVKDVRPDDTDQDDTGRFDIDVEGGSLDLDEAKDGDQATVNLPPTQDVTITETEDGDDTDLAFYDTSISCVNGQGDPVVTSGTTADIDVDSNDSWVCTVINTRRTGSVKVVKDVRPDDTDQDDTGRFDIDVEGGSLDLDEAADGDDATVAMQPAQDVSITETEDGDDTDLSKYDTSISCVNGAGQPVVTQGATAEIDVQSNDAWVCTVINTRRTGTIEVEKVTLPADDDGHFDLYAGDETDPVAENVQNGGSGSDAVQPGTYPVSEQGNGSDLADYQSSVECTKNGDPYIAGHAGTSDDVTVDSNDVVHCTFTNVRLGTVKITKETVVPETQDAQSFAFTGGGLTADFSLKHGETETVTGVVPNAGGADYVVGEPNVNGYRVTSVACDDDDSEGVRAQDKQSGEAQIQVSPGETVECTFVNEKLALTVDVDKKGTDAAHHGDTVTYTFDVTNTGNGPIADVAVDDTILGTDADLCQPTIKSKGTELGTADVLDEGETWTFECTYDLSDTHAAPGEQPTPAGVPDEVVNKAKATGTGEDDTPVSSDSNEHTTLVYHPDLELTKLVKVKGSSADYAASTQAYVGDTLQFKVSIENTGDAPLALDELTDVISGAAPADACVLATTGDDTLAVGETQDWTCEVLVTSEVDDFTNTATVKGSHELPTSTVTVPGEGSATVDVLHPAIAIDKQGPAAVKAGEVISYELIVTNPGDVSFASQKVVVTDKRCDEPPVLVTKNGDASADQLDPGDTWTYTCSVLTSAADTSVENVADVEGTDPNGRKVTDSDKVTTVVEQIAVLPEQIQPGSARLSGPASCVSKAFKVRVRGQRIANVTYRIDGKRVKRQRARSGQTRFTFRVNPRKYSYRVHRLKVRVKFLAGTDPKARTLRMTFQRCARQVVEPVFTG